MKLRLALSFLYLVFGGLLLSKLRKAEVDLRKYNEGRSDASGSQLPQQYLDGSIGLHTPYDMPIYARVFRLLKETGVVNNTGAVEELKGWTLELDAFTFSVKLFVRIGMDGTLKVFCQDDDKPVKLEEWTKDV